MDKLTRRKLLAMGLGQLDEEGLKRLIAWDGPMLLDGAIYDREKGHC